MRAACWTQHAFELVHHVFIVSLWWNNPFSTRVSFIMCSSMQCNSLNGFLSAILCFIYVFTVNTCNCARILSFSLGSLSLCSLRTVNSFCSASYGVHLNGSKVKTESKHHCSSTCPEANCVNVWWCYTAPHASFDWQILFHPVFSVVSYTHTHLDLQTIFAPTPSPSLYTHEHLL